MLSGRKPTRSEVHNYQSKMVADSVLHETGYEVYRRRLVRGTTAAMIRDEVRNAITSALSNSSLSHADAANAGAMAVDHALAKAGIEVERMGLARDGWKGRLVNIELLMLDRKFEAAHTELQALIDGIHQL